MPNLVAVRRSCRKKACLTLIIDLHSFRDPSSPIGDESDGITLLFLPRWGSGTWSVQPKCQDQDGSTLGDDGRTA